MWQTVSPYIGLQNRQKEAPITRSKDFSLTTTVAVQLKFKKKNVIIFCIYRAPLGDFDYFLNKMDNMLYSLHNYKAKFIICGDININYLGANIKKKQLDNLLATYNLTGTVYFPTRIANNSITLLDNIFVITTRNAPYNCT